jgi:hypothetical protein
VLLLQLLLLLSAPWAPLWDCCSSKHHLLLLPLLPCRDGAVWRLTKSHRLPCKLERFLQLLLLLSLVRQRQDLLLLSPRLLQTGALLLPLRCLCCKAGA